MKELEPYKKCPHFNDPTQQCCGRFHDQEISELRKKRVRINFKNGGIKSIHAYDSSGEITTLENNRGNCQWVTITPESEQVISLLQQDFANPNLTCESRRALQEIHPVFTRSPIFDDCECFKRKQNQSQENTKKNI